ncbi:MAG: cysteine-rich CWC family protein [Acidovorax soli]|nr:cysteine-rich CWC family protein [Acidovorax soli]MCM2346406.1 cysteine-rich CWC family protein [Acidovorax soli]
MPRPEPDPACCPLCGQPNQCAMAAGQPPESCWCMTKRIAPGALDALPVAERGQRCICPACGAPGSDTPQPPI